MPAIPPLSLATGEQAVRLSDCSPSGQSLRGSVPETATSAQAWIGQVDPDGDLEATRDELATWINQLLGY